MLRCFGDGMRLKSKSNMKRMVLYSKQNAVGASAAAFPPCRRLHQGTLMYGLECLKTDSKVSNHGLDIFWLGLQADGSVHPNQKCEIIRKP